MDRNQKLSSSQPTCGNLGGWRTKGNFEVKFSFQVHAQNRDFTHVLKNELKNWDHKFVPYY